MPPSADGLDRCVELVVVEIGNGRPDIWASRNLDQCDRGAVLVDVPWNVVDCERRPHDEYEWGILDRSHAATPLVRYAQIPPVVDDTDGDIGTRLFRHVDDRVGIHYHDNAVAVRCKHPFELLTNPALHGVARTASRSVSDGVDPRGSR
jgi:hypothetical protein